jgi:hypothetical protein
MLIIYAIIGSPMISAGAGKLAFIAILRYGGLKDLLTFL